MIQEFAQDTCRYGDGKPITLKFADAVGEVCSLANRNLSLAEWEQYVGSNSPYRRTYPDLPPGRGAPVR